MKTLILSLSLICLASSYAYKITSESNCLQYDPTYKVCSKWSQSGTIEQDVSCFIEDTIVKEKIKGFIKIKDVEQGDQIITLKEGKEIWSIVEGWLHKNSIIEGVYYNLTLANGGWIGVSKKHNLAFKSQSNTHMFRFPDDDIKDQQLYPCSKKIEEKTFIKAQGKYALLTSESSYLIFTQNGLEPILVHDFANIRNPEMYEIPFNSILSIAKAFNGGHLMNSEGVNIAADWLMNKFSFLLD